MNTYEPLMNVFNTILDEIKKHHSDLIMITIGNKHLKFDFPTLPRHLGPFNFLEWEIVAILFLTKTALKVIKDYEEQKKAGIEPVFDPVKLGIKGADFWEEKVKESDSKGKKKLEEKQLETENTVHF